MELHIKISLFKQMSYGKSDWNKSTKANVHLGKAQA